MGRPNDNVAVGIKVFSRVEKLRKLLASIPDWVSTVYIADDGELSDTKYDMYTKSYQFNVRVINLKYNIGAGAGRNAIIDALSEDYIIIVDPDHRVPPNAPILYQQLTKCQNIGGIGGIIFEPERHRLYTQAQQFKETKTQNGTQLVREASNVNKPIELVNGAPLTMWDWIPQAGIFRRKCLEDQNWDPKFINNYEHLDFFLSHWKKTDWQFAVSPCVQFSHYPGGDTSYMTHRNDPDLKSEAREYLLSKWNYTDIVWPDNKWIEVSGQPRIKENIQNARSILQNEGTVSLGIQIKQFIRNRI